MFNVKKKILSYVHAEQKMFFECTSFTGEIFTSENKLENVMFRKSISLPGFV